MKITKHFSTDKNQTLSQWKEVKNLVRYVNQKGLDHAQ